MTRPLSLLIGVFVFLAGLIAGCDLFASSKQEDKPPPDLQKVAATAVDPGLEVRVFAPDTVEKGGPFEIRLRAKNRTNKDLILEVNGCIFEPDILDLAYGHPEDRSHVPFKGSNVGCLVGVTRHLIREGEALTESFQLQAVRETSSGGEEPVSLGTYAGRVELNKWRIGQAGHLEEAKKIMLSALEWTFVVRP